MEAIQDNRGYKGGKIREYIDKLKKIKNIEIVAALVILAIVLIVYTGINNASGRISKSKANDSLSTDSDKLELKLEGILSDISGAGKVRVMITYNGSVEYVTANTSNINTNTSTDNNRTNSTTSTTISPVIINSNGSSKPVIIKEIEPSIKGVIVVAEGADNIAVRLELMRAVMVALNIGAENIEIFPMK